MVAKMGNILVNLRLRRHTRSRGTMRVRPERTWMIFYLWCRKTTRLTWWSKILQSHNRTTCRAATQRCRHQYQGEVRVARVRVTLRLQHLRPQHLRPPQQQPPANGDEGVHQNIAQQSSKKRLQNTRMRDLQNGDETAQWSSFHLRPRGERRRCHLPPGEIQRPGSLRERDRVESRT
jgi:hypothetical protein